VSFCSVGVLLFALVAVPACSLLLVLPVFASCLLLLCCRGAVAVFSRSVAVVVCCCFVVAACARVHSAVCGWALRPHRRARSTRQSRFSLCTAADQCAAPSPSHCLSCGPHLPLLGTLHDIPLQASPPLLFIFCRITAQCAVCQSRAAVFLPFLAAVGAAVGARRVLFRGSRLTLLVPNGTRVRGFRCCHLAPFPSLRHALSRRLLALPPLPSRRAAFPPHSRRRCFPPLLLACRLGRACRARVVCASSSVATQMIAMRLCDRASTHTRDCQRCKSPDATHTASLSVCQHRAADRHLHRIRTTTFSCWLVLGAAPSARACSSWLAAPSAWARAPPCCGGSDTQCQRLI